jgi:hypothetical protein
VSALKQESMRQVDNEEMASRLFESMLKHGGPGSVGVAERPFYHEKYFSEQAQSMGQRVAVYEKTLDELSRSLALVSDRSLSSTLSPASTFLQDNN